MAFDIFNAVLFKVMADRKDIQDSNKIMVVAGLSSGTPLTKILTPLLMLQQAEETKDKEKEIIRLNALQSGKKPG
jgi:hypothetical protein